MITRDTCADTPGIDSLLVQRCGHGVVSALGEAGSAGLRGSGALGCQPAEGPHTATRGLHLWVGASAHGRAEMTLVRVMPYLTREAARHADGAWRGCGLAVRRGVAVPDRSRRT